VRSPIRRCYAGTAGRRVAVALFGVLSVVVIIDQFGELL
jgi:hypothetical protein